MVLQMVLRMDSRDSVAERSTDHTFVSYVCREQGIISPPVHENYAMSQQLWRLEMKHCLLYLFNLADAINDLPSVLEEVLHSRSCSISLFVWVSHVSPNWWNLHIPKSE